jgi:hypothetical protein
MSVEPGSFFSFFKFKILFLVYSVSQNRSQQASSISKERRGAKGSFLGFFFLEFFFSLFFNTKSVPHGARTTGGLQSMGGGRFSRARKRGLEGVLGGGFERGSLTLERVYSGCMGWVHAPPPPLAAPPNLF